MRTIKFLGFAVALATTTAPAFAQGNLQPGAFPGIDRLARIEANRLAHRQQMRALQGNRMGRMQGAGPIGQRQAFRGGFRGARMGAGGFAPGARMGARQFAAGPRFGARAGARAGAAVGMRAGVQAGVRAGYRAGVRAERLKNATPEQKAFFEQLRKQRETVHAQVVDGKLTREQARAQMQKWIAEHRPAK